MTESTDASSVEIADTLDEVAIRNLFPDAPRSIAAPRGTRSMFAARMRHVGGRRRTVGIAAFGVLTAAGIVLVATGQAGPGIVLLVVMALATLAIALWQFHKATTEFYRGYAAARGLSIEKDGFVPGSVPLLSRGDKRRFANVMTGRIAGQLAHLAHYTYTQTKQGSDGSTTPTEYDFTVLAFTLPPQVAARYTGLSLAPKSLSFGALQDKLAKDHKVELESVEFHRRYSLRALDTQDEVALWQLFSPPFIELLATQMKCCWEQRGSDLLFWRKRHDTDTASLDRFCFESSHVLRRYLEEWR